MITFFVARYFDVVESTEEMLAGLIFDAQLPTGLNIGDSENAKRPARNQRSRSLSHLTRHSPSSE